MNFCWFSLEEVSNCRKVVSSCKILAVSQVVVKLMVLHVCSFVFEEVRFGGL